MLSLLISQLKDTIMKEILLYGVQQETAATVMTARKFIPWAGNIFLISRLTWPNMPDLITEMIRICLKGAIPV